MTAPNQILQSESGGTPLGWHKLESFLRCPKEYQLSVIRKLVTPVNQTPDALGTGTLFHAGRAAWFVAGFGSDAATWELVQSAVYTEAERQKLPISDGSVKLSLATLQEYIKHWRLRQNPKPLAIEYMIGPAPLAANDPLYPFRTARLDDVGYYPEAGGKLAIEEAKTTTNVADCINQYELHGQPLMQMALWKLAPQGEAMHGPIAGVVLDAAEKAYKSRKPHFARQFIPVPQHALEWYIDEIRGYLVAANALDWNAKAPRNINACTRLVGAGKRVPCPFRDLCKHGRGAAGQFVFEDTGKGVVTWRPEPGKETPPWI